MYKRQGHLWNITWTQGSETTFFLYDSNGRPLTLTAGRSYRALVSSLTFGFEEAAAAIKAAGFTSVEVLTGHGFETQEL